MVCFYPTLALDKALSRKEGESQVISHLGKTIHSAFIQQNSTNNTLDPF